MYDDPYVDDVGQIDDPGGGGSGSGSGSGYNYQLYVNDSSSPAQGQSTAVTGSFDVPVVGSRSSSNASNVNATPDVLTFAVTVASGSNAYGSGNKFYIDGVQSASLRNIIEDTATYRFDQSDSSNAGHPLLFSTTPDGQHASGSNYTTGVTSVGTPGSSGAHTEVSIALNSDPYLYYYCQNHSGMGNDPWSGEDFTGEINATPISSIYGWTAANLTSPAVYYGRLGSFNTVSDPSTTWAQVSIPSDGHLSFSYNTDSSDERVYVYKNGSLVETITYSNTLGGRGSSGIAVTAGDVVKWAFESISYTAWVDDISLALAGDYALVVSGSETASEASSPMIYLTRKVNRTVNFW